MHFKAKRILFFSGLIIFLSMGMLIVWKGSSARSSDWPLDGNPNDRGRALNSVRQKIKVGMGKVELQKILGEPNVISDSQSATIYWDQAKKVLKNFVKERDTLWIYFVYLEQASWYEDIPPERFVVVIDDRGDVSYVSTDKDIRDMYGVDP